MKWSNVTNDSVLWYEEPFAFDHPMVSQVPQDVSEIPQSINYQPFIDDLFNSPDADAYQIQKFNAHVHTLPSQLLPDLLPFGVLWIEHHGYGLSEVNRLLEIVRYGRSSLQGKLNIPLTIEEIEHIWIEHSLEKHFSCDDLGEDLDRIKWELSRYSPEICAKFFQHIQNLSDAPVLLSFLAFLRKYEIAEDEFLKLISGPIALERLREKLVVPIIWKAIPLDFSYKERIAYQLSRMMKQGWSLSSVLALVEIAKEKVTDTAEAYWVLLALELVVEYQLTEKDSDTAGIGVNQIFVDARVKRWAYWVGQLSVLLRFSSANPQDNLPEIEKAQALINEVLERNKDNPVIVKHITDQVSDIISLGLEKHGLTSSFILQDKPIQTWAAEDIQEWCKAQETEEKPITLSEKLAVLKQAVFLAHGYEARPIQLIAVGLLYTADKGILAEINTGEGKSIIAAMLAVLKALEIKSRIKDEQGNIIKIERRVVDIVTSSAVLAQRDAEEQAPFYQLFGLTVAHNIGRSANKPCYERDIVYGDTVNFVADILDRDDSTRVAHRGNRPLDVVIVDEVDNMFIDQASDVTMLTRGIPGFTYLEPILVTLWKLFEQLDSHLVYDVSSKSWLLIEGEFSYQNGRVTLLGEGSKAYVIEDRNAMIKKTLQSHLENLIGAEPPSLHIPTALKSFVVSQQENWINGVLKASASVEGRDYVVSKDKDGRAAILTVDYQNTGVVQQNREWSDGVHQFLQIKYGFPLKAEGLMTRFLSNMAFFRSYQGGIYGMTGTLGAEDEKQFVNEMYGVDFLRVPTYRPKRFLELPPLLADGKENWEQTLWSVIDKEINRDRAVLIIVETINQVNEIEAYLKQYDWLADKVKAYSRNDLPDQARHQTVEVGDIIIATNIAGRGTDLKTTEALEKNGGLHVCIGYLPTNRRVQWQAYGRTARQGNRGTGQLVIDRQEAIRYLHARYPWYRPGDSAEDLLAWQDLAETDRLLRDRYFRKELVEIKDDLHTKFFAYAEGLFQGAADPLEVKYDVQQMEDLWGMWLKRQEPEISYFDGKKLQVEDQAYFKEKNAAIRQKANQALNQLITEINKDYQEQKLIRNPGYLTRKAIDILFDQSDEDKAIFHLDKAIMLDPIYSLGANYLKARAVVMRDNGAKQEAYDSFFQAKLQIHQWLIPQLESMLLMVNLYAIERNESPLSKQILSKIEVLKKIDSFIDSAMKVIVESKSEELIQIKAATLLKDVMGWDDNHDPEIGEFREEGILALFELNAYEEEKDWFGTFASFVFGVVQIAVGVLMAPVNVGVSASLIAGGVGDILSSIRSVITGQPIDFDQYLSNKGIEYAINILVAGATALKESLMGKQLATQTATAEAGKQITKEEATKAVLQEVKNQLIERGLAMSIGYVAEAVMGKGLAEYEDDIRESVKRGIAHLAPEAFSRVFLYDIVMNIAAKENRIRNHAIKLLRSYREKYYTAAARITKGVAQGLAAQMHPSGGIAFQAVEMGHSIARISDVTDDFINDFSQYLSQETASYPTPEALLAIKIRDQSTNQAIADEVMQKLRTQGFIVDQHVDNAEQIANQHFPARPETEVILIRRLCIEIETADKADKQGKINAFKAMLTEQVTSSIMAMIKGEVLSPLSAMAGTFSSKAILDKLGLLQTTTLTQQKAESTRRDVEASEKVGEATQASTEPTASVPPPPPISNIPEGEVPSTEEAQPFTYARFRQMDTYMRKIFGQGENANELGQLGGFGDIALLSRAFGKNIHVYQDGVYEQSFSGEGAQAEDAIRVNYDSFERQWGRYTLFPEENNAENKWGTIYDVLAVGTGGTGRELRTIAAKYMRENPGEAHSLLTVYSADYGIEDKPKPTKPNKQEKPKQGQPIQNKPKQPVKPSGLPTVEQPIKPVERGTTPTVYPPHVVEENRPLWEIMYVEGSKKIGKAAGKLDEFYQNGKDSAKKNFPGTYEFAKEGKRRLGEFADEVGTVIDKGKAYRDRGIAWLSERPDYRRLVFMYGWSLYQKTDTGKYVSTTFTQGQEYVFEKIGGGYHAAEEYLIEKTGIPTKADIDRVNSQNRHDPDFVRGLAAVEAMGRGAGTAIDLADTALTVTGLGAIGKTITKETYQLIAKNKGLFVSKIFRRSTSIDDVARQWRNPAIKANQFELEIKGNKFRADPTMDPRGVPVFTGATDKQVKDYTFELMKSVGCRDRHFPEAIVRNGHIRHTYKNQETGVSVTLRSESKSADSTGAKWTIDINKHPAFPKNSRPEIKFKGE